MSRRDEYEQKAEALLAPIVEGQGFELVDVEYVKEAGNWYLRGYIDKPGGIAVDDCEAVSRAFSDKLDENDFIEDSYIMEISSPGLDRPLKKDKVTGGFITRHQRIVALFRMLKSLIGLHIRPAGNTAVIRPRDIGILFGLRQSNLP